jgi:hypothetical protein
MHAINNSTPETDKQEAMDNGDTVPLLDFARKLERERDEARQLARELRDALELKMVDHRPYGSAQLARHKKSRQLIEKAKEVLP